MSITVFTADFVQFCNEMNENISSDEYHNLYNGYNTFLLTQKYPLDKIKGYRQNALVGYYAERNELPDECLNDLHELYKDNVNDTYDKKIIPCIPDADDMKDYAEYDDIKEHYDFLDAKYKYYAELNHKLTHPTEVNLDDSIYEDEEEEDDSYIEDDNYESIDDDMYDDDAYDDYEDDYYSDEEYY